MLSQSLQPVLGLIVDVTQPNAFTGYDAIDAIVVLAFTVVVGILLVAVLALAKVVVVVVVVVVVSIIKPSW